MSKTENDFMKFMEKEYGAKFIDTKVEGGEKPKEPPPLPQAWVGMFDGYKRDAMYYEMCIKHLRDGIRKEHAKGKEYYNSGVGMIEIMLTHMLEAGYALDGVDLDKPNYGMF